MEGEDVRVGQTGRDANLAEKAVASHGLCEVRIHYLDGNEPVVAEIDGAIHRGHPSTSDKRLDAIAVAEGVGHSFDHGLSRYRRIGREARAATPEGGVAVAPERMRKLPRMVQLGTPWSFA